MSKETESSGDCDDEDGCQGSGDKSYTKGRAINFAYMHLESSPKLSCLCHYLYININHG